MDNRCQVVPDRDPIALHRYDPRSIRSENSLVTSDPCNLHNRHYYHIVAQGHDFYFYVGMQGNVLEFDTRELFDAAQLTNDPTLGSGHEPVAGVPKPDLRPTRFERLLRENEIWEEYKPPPKPLRVRLPQKEITAEELAEIFDKPKKLIKAAPNPMDIDIIKCMEEVINKSR